VGLPPSLAPVVRRRARLYPEWVQALFELRYCPGTVDLDTLEALASVAHERCASPLPTPAPALLAARNGFTVLRWADLYILAVCLGRTIYHRGEADRRRLGWALYHELAEGILARSGLPHQHVDVQALTLLLLIPRGDVVVTLRRMGAREGTSWLCRRHRWAPAWAVRWRVALVFAAAQAA
jgi:hypothetical protein